MHAASLQSILDNYEVYFWEEIKDDITDSGIKARVIGVEATMSNFNFLFGLLLGELGDNDFVASSLETQLELLPAMFSSLPEKPTLSTIRAYITDLSPATCIGISEGQA